MNNKKKDVKTDEEIRDEEVETMREVDAEVSELDHIQQEIEDLKALNKELENKYLMAYADAQNLERRAKVDAENLVVNKVSKIVEDILPALDNFERALANQPDDENVQNFLKGFEMIYQQLYSALLNEGVEQIESVGIEFDPNYHQSIGHVKDDNYDSNIVVEELQKGYIFRKKVIRPAMVKVNE